MRVPRIYQPGELNSGNKIELSAVAFQHVVKVLRLSLGSKIILFNGLGVKAEACIVDVTKKSCWAEISEVIQVAPAKFKLTLAQGIIKTDKMDLVIQKAVELGVTQIIPIITENSQIKQTQNLFEKKQQHWHNIIISACEQSGVDYLPQLELIQDLTSFLKNYNADRKIVLDPYATQPLKHSSDPIESLIVVIGPEGGLTTDEVKCCQQENFIPVKFGQRILRAETASIAVLSLSQFLWGDLA